MMPLLVLLPDLIRMQNCSAIKPNVIAIIQSLVGMKQKLKFLDKLFAFIWRIQGNR
jgi:hypothetical protein